MTQDDKQYADSTKLDARVALHQRFATGAVDMFRSAWTRYPFAPRQRLLEVGCGTGVFWIHPAADVPEGATLHLTDRSPGMLAKTRETLADGPSAIFEEADVMALPYADHTFDGVIANFVLFAVSDPSTAIAEMARVLKPGGFLGMLNPGTRHMHQIFEASGTPPPPFPSGQELVKLLPAHFEVTETIALRDELIVTELEPLLAWVRSMPLPAETIEAGVARLAPIARSEIETNEALCVERETILTTARRS